MINSNNPALNDQRCLVFISKVHDILKRHRIQLKFKNTKNYSEISEAGEFNVENKTLSCVVKPRSKSWIGDLAHEYCHFIQYINSRREWVKFQKEPLAFSRLTPLSKSERVAVLKTLISLELICEKMAVRLIKDEKLPVNLKKYAKEANFILFKYIYWGERGKWPRRMTRWHNCAAMKLVPKRLMSRKDYNFKKIPDEIIRHFDQSFKI
jgi:hypothetical protein